MPDVFRSTFTTPFEQHADREGQRFTFTGETIAHETHPDRIDEGVGPLYRIRFEDGVEIDAWPDEVLP